MINRTIFRHCVSLLVEGDLLKTSYMFIKKVLTIKNR